MSPIRFRRLVKEAIKGLPQEIQEALQNVDIVVRWRPNSWERQRAGVGPGEPLFGLYLGTPLPQRGAGYTLVLPDQIVIFQEPHERAASDEAELVQELRTTILHEVGHYLGLDEEGLSRLGLE